MKWCYNPTRKENGDCDKWCFYNTKDVITNADRIRQMSDEELAEFLNEVRPAERFLTKTWLEWLKKEVEK